MHAFAHPFFRDMLWEEELEAKRIQDDEDRKRKVASLNPKLFFCIIFLCRTE